MMFVSVIKHAVPCFCQELIYAFGNNAGINDGCKITKKTSAVCVCVRACVRSWSHLSTHVLYEAVTDALCLLELECLWFDSI